MVKKFFLLSLFFIFLIVISAFPSDWEIVWQDEFNGTVSSDWSYDIGYGSWGWGNDEWQFYTQENAIITDSSLIIRATLDGVLGKRDGSIKSVKLITQNKFSVQYGKIEARIKLPRGKGLWPAFWMLGTNISEVGWPECGEIDIMENINGESTIHGTAHWDADNQHDSYGCHVNQVDIENFHTYTLLWDEHFLRWELNGEEYCSLDITEEDFSEFHQHFYLILNLAVGGRWPGNPDSTIQFPADMEIDYVRVYRLKSPKMGLYPSELNYSMDIGDAASLSKKTVSITNMGTEILESAAVEADADWIDLSWKDNSGNTQSFEVSVNENANLLTRGSYSAILSITSENAPAETAMVRLQVGENIVLNKVTRSSSVEPNPPENENVSASNVNDGNKTTRWLSEASDPQWISIDLNKLFLNKLFSIDAVKLFWGEGYAREYQIQIAKTVDFSEYSVIASDTMGNGGNDFIETDNSVSGRYIRMYGISRGNELGYSLYEFEVYGGVSADVSLHDNSVNEMSYKLKTYPNPFNAQTTINFSVPEKQKTSIDVFNVNGKLVGNLDSGIKNPGHYQMTFNGNDLSSGVYFFRLKTSNQMITQKVMLQK